MSLVKSALKYAEQDIPVFPIFGIDDQGLCSCYNPTCTNPGKHPMTKHGHKDASTDTAQIVMWWKNNPHANIGVPTGSLSGWYAIDVDSKNNGIANYQKFLAKQGDQIPTESRLKSKTGGGGYHLIYAAPLDGKSIGISVNTGNVMGVDFRGDGGYIVVPPSKHSSGNKYQWATGFSFPTELPLTPLPETIANLVRTAKRNPTSTTVIQKGGRNDFLFKEACKCLRNDTPEEQLYTILLQINKNRCNPNLYHSEVKKIAESACLQSITPITKQGLEKPSGAILPSRVAASTTTNTQAKKSYSAKQQTTNKSSTKNPNKALTNLLSLTTGHQFWTDEVRTAYVTFPVPNYLSNSPSSKSSLASARYENWQIHSSEYKHFLMHIFHHEFNYIIQQSIVDRAIHTLEGKALFNGTVNKTYIRTATFEGCVYIDLTNENWDVVKITEDGWSILQTKPPVKFLRTVNTKALPYPDEKGSLDNLEKIFRLQNKNDYTLVAAWMMFALLDKGPYPILAIEGVAGSSKSTLTKQIRRLIDPRKPATQGKPRKLDDLHVQANSSHLLAFDNLSSINQDLSDTLCGVATGTGISKRELHKNSSEICYEFSRPILFNSVNPVTQYSDLADRCIGLSLASITSNQSTDGHIASSRFSSEVVEETFQQWAPNIMGGLFTAIQTALPNYKSFNNIPAEIRMIDFAQWGLAAEAVLPKGTLPFTDILMANRRHSSNSLLEENILNSAVLDFIQERKEWVGTATELLSVLKKRISPAAVCDPSFPKMPNRLTRELNSSITTLKLYGVTYQSNMSNSHKNRRISLSYTPIQTQVKLLKDSKVSTLETPRSDLTLLATPALFIDLPAVDTAAGQIILLSDLRESEIALKHFIEKGSTLGLNIKTSNLNPRSDQLYLIQLSDGDTTAIFNVLKIGDLSSLSPLFSQLKAVAHHAIFSMSFLQVNGLTVDLDCTQLAHHVLTGETKNLNYLAEHYLNVTLDKTAQDSAWSGDLTEQQLAYAASDASTVLALHLVLQRLLAERHSTRAYQLVQKAQPCVMSMQLTGFPIDKTGYEQMLMTLKTEHAQQLDQWNTFAPNISFSSALQLSTWITANLKNTQTLWPKTANGSYSTKSENFIFYKTDLQESAAEVVESLLLPLKRSNKLISSFGDKFLAHIDHTTQRIHSTFNLSGTVTGRMSCSQPNLQQIPRISRYREMFLAAAGYKLVIGDYSQMELRIAAITAEEGTLLDAYEQEKDTHILTAALILGKDPEEVTKEERQLAKAINFGLLYGQSAAGLQSYASNSYGVTISLEQAQAYRTAWFDNYPALARWHLASYQLAKNTMMVSTPMGRNRYFASTDYNHPQCLKHAIVYNTPIQGGAAEVLLAAMHLLTEAISTQGYSDMMKPIAVVHDEIVLEVQQDFANTAKKLLEQAMIEGMLTIFPTAEIKGLVEASIGNNWAAK